MRQNIKEMWLDEMTILQNRADITNKQTSSRDVAQSVCLFGCVSAAWLQQRKRMQQCSRLQTRHHAETRENYIKERRHHPLACMHTSAHSNANTRLTRKASSRTLPCYKNQATAMTPHGHNQRPYQDRR